MTESVTANGFALDTSGQRIVVDPICRIEGHLRIEVNVDENNVIRKQIHDPRIHFALNCASGSCPILRPSDWSEDDLEAATRGFINNPDNVSVKDGKVWFT